MISTGTPAGVALEMPQPEYLKPVDIVELGINRLGTARQEVKSWQDLQSIKSAGKHW